jgi:hypothetical protein
MKYQKHLSFALLLSISVAGCSNPQTKSFPPPVLTPVQPGGASVENGIFESREGGFSLAIPQMPTRTLDSGKEKAKAKGIDTGKMFIWQFEKITYTASYLPSVDLEGNPMPQLYEDMEIGSRKGIHNANAKLISEKPIKLGEERGTEFRYITAEGAAVIGRIYLVGDMGYSIVGLYSEKKDEKNVVEVLDSFKLLKSKP